MRQLLRLTFVGSLLVSPLTASAMPEEARQAGPGVTADDLVNLKAQGLGDDVLVALIESHGTVFTLDASDVIALRKRGLSDRVLVTMLMSGRRTQVPPAAPPAAVVIEVPVPPRRVVAEVSDEAPAPPVVNVTQTVSQRQVVEQPHERTVYVPVSVPVPVYVAPRVPEKAPEPIYWGFNGQRRPDAWQEAPKVIK